MRNKHYSRKIFLSLYKKKINPEKLFVIMCIVNDILYYQEYLKPKANNVQIFLSRRPESIFFLFKP